mmetsp:Transcript_10187/g.30596  ORF Transcript_10187/g.30596 Transcript_10187/m.30596 type:complete len:238 (+) Transcript_10187:135-848(+)
MHSRVHGTGRGAAGHSTTLGHRRPQHAGKEAPHSRAGAWAGLRGTSPRNACWLTRQTAARPRAGLASRWLQRLPRSGPSLRLTAGLLGATRVCGRGLLCRQAPLLPGGFLRGWYRSRLPGQLQRVAVGEEAEGVGGEELPLGGLYPFLLGADAAQEAHQAVVVWGVRVPELIDGPYEFEEGQRHCPKTTRWRAVATRPHHIHELQLLLEHTRLCLLLRRRPEGRLAPVEAPGQTAGA